MATATIIHAPTDWKGRTGHGTGHGIVPLCSKWAMTPRYGVTNPDPAKVSCTRCAKQLGITPAPKQVSSTQGTCQCCFGGYETRQKGDKGDFRLVLHGYQRPGDGYIIGDCRGHGHVPYEVSCEQTKVFREELKGILAAREERREQLQTDKVPTLTASVSTGKRIPDTNPRHRGYGMTVEEHKDVEVPLGQGKTPNPWGHWEKVPSYDELRTRGVARLDGAIRAIKKDIAFLTEKINGWVKQSFPKGAAAEQK